MSGTAWQQAAGVVTGVESSYLELKAQSEEKNS